MRPLLAAAIAGLCLASGPSYARPFTIEDFLALEDIGEAAITDDGRWLILERLPPYGQVGDFGTDAWLRLGGRKLLVADLKAAQPALEPLFAQAPGAGYVAGPISPGGERMVVYRLHARTWTMGVVDLSTRKVRWFELAVERQSIARTAQWRDDRNLVVIAAPAGAGPSMLRRELAPATLLPAFWRATAKGETAVSAIGAGRWLTLRTRTPDTRIIEVDVADGAERLVAEGPFLDLELSPDSSSLAVLTREEDLPPARELVSAVLPYRVGLRIVDRLSGETRIPCGQCDHLPHLMSWSSSGHEVLSFAREQGRSWEEGRFMRLNRSGSVQVIDEGRPKLAYHVTTGKTASAFWMGDDPAVLVTSADGRAQWRLATRDGSIDLTRRFATTPARPVAADARFAWFLQGGALWRTDRRGVASPVVSRVKAVAPGAAFGDGARATWSSPPSFADLRLDRGSASSGVVELSAPATQRTVAARGGAALVASTDDRGVRRLTLHSAAGKPATLLTLNRHLGAVDPVRMEQISHVGRSGRPLFSWLFLPSDTSAPPPVVVVPYPGPARGAPSTSFLPGQENPIANVQLLVGAGYAVLQPSLPLEAGDRETIHHVAEDILAIVDAAAQRELVDGQRVALWGHSFGAYTVMMAATQSPRFASVIAMAGIYDLASVRNVGPLHERLDPRQGASIAWTAGWTQDAQANMRAGPWAHPDDYVRNSPLFAADRIVAPVMLVHNDLDYIPPWQAEQMFGALHAQDKDAVLLTYWGEGHGVRSPGNLRDLYVRALDWLDRGFNGAPRGALPTPAPRPPSAKR
ncbi:prolyl oligopeptidase family serine peptidase [Caulobacter sp. 73W]|uniref:Prolyl oligopeptidase family serine peptidase n=1 Tax=Caulobacter sp. 73W TaxID=3161137 RepID=A0AB39KXT0_9CAUL